MWVCLKMFEIAIFHRDHDQQNHWVFRGLAYIFRHTHVELPEIFDVKPIPIDSSAP